MISFEIEGRQIGGGAPCYLIAEVAQSHDGDIERAHRYVDAAANSGADAVKFQTHIARHESTLDEPFRAKIPGGDRTRYEYWRRMEFTPEQWRELAAHSRERGLTFLSSAFSLEAVELLVDIGMPAWKVASGEVRSAAILEAMLQTGAPMLISSGMSRIDELDVSVAGVRSAGVPFGIFQCTSMYPTPMEKVGLNMLGEFRQRYECPIGLSDHSGEPYPALAAIALGADMLELHLLIEPEHSVPDGPSSLDPEEFRLVRGMRDAVVAMRDAPVIKDAMAAELEAMRAIFTRSLAPRHNLASGTVLRTDMLTSKKPGTGIPADALHDVVGRRLRNPVDADRVIKWSDLEN